jgi:hypothetical protein
MRLGQLARKLALRPSQIVDYLSAQGIFNEEGSNARLSDEIANQIVLHFAPARVNEILSSDEKNPEPTAVLVTKQEELVIEDKSKSEREIETFPTEALVLSEEKPEVIKAPKVELTGLKVLGKIDLPEPKKKTTPMPEISEAGNHAVDKTEIEKRPVRRDLKDSVPRRESYKQRPARNSIAEQREKKAREEEAKRRLKAERDKEKRAQYYFQRVKTGQPTKAVKLVSEPLESYSFNEAKPEPKAWWGKFLRWLNS